MSENWMSGLYLALAVVVFLSGAAAIWFGVKTHTITRTHTVKVEKSYGKLSATMDCAQINQQLAGLTCDIYQSSNGVTIVAHK